MAAEIERWGKVVSSLALSRTEFWGIGVMSAIECSIEIRFSALLSI
jgi:hypothetical protein